MVREPVVSGQFYPAQQQQLRRIIESLTPKKSTKEGALGIILPHAGYVYSGKVAITTVSSILPKKRIVILGPNHTGFGKDFALSAKGTWKIPFGNVDIDTDLSSALLKNSDIIQEDPLAHKFEHSIEVELPILYHFFGEFQFVPLACQASTLDRYRKVALQIAEATKLIKNEILFVASSDLTHYEPDSTARKKDRDALESIVSLDEEGLLERVSRQNITMCGVAPVAVLIRCLKELGARKSHVALYETSGDTSGDYSSVVGYAGVVIS
ncbi:MAG: AmmeMemoRadiSam system protein B [Candidatus Omnitrophota bacterium]|nr:MAG: AmmeMemoRadiSam system protein B [Candidatus Omnitrophota bacterium]